MSLRPRRSRPTLVVLAAAAVAVVVASLSVLQPNHPAARKEAAGADDSSTPLVAANHRVLTSAETRRLLRFADAFQSCMSRRGVAIAKPEPQAIRIEMRLAVRVKPREIARVSFACGTALGDPPRGSSLVTPPDGKTIELYLPKQCLLDPKVAAAHDGRR